MKKKSNLTLFMKQLIRSLKEEERFSTAHIYQSTLNAFMLFCKTDAIRFNQMERSRLKQFENHLRNKGCTWNTVSTYMRTLRSIYNKAVDDGLAEEKPRLFRHVYTGVKANTKRALDAKDMSKLLSASLPRPLPQSMKESRAWITLMFLWTDKSGRRECRNSERQRSCRSTAIAGNGGVFRAFREKGQIFEKSYRYVECSQ